MTRAKFESDGFVRLQGFFDAEFMWAVESAVARYVETVVPGLPAGRVFREANGEAIKSMSAMDREDEFFARLKHHPRFIALAAELLGAAEEEIVAENMQFFGKAAAGRIGGAVASGQRIPELYAAGGVHVLAGAG